MSGNKARAETVFADVHLCSFATIEMNANSWYNDSHAPRPDLREINPGFSFSGPITIPKIYNGKNRSFFAVTYSTTNSMTLR